MCVCVLSVLDVPLHAMALRSQGPGAADTRRFVLCNPPDACVRCSVCDMYVWWGIDTELGRD